MTGRYFVSYSGSTPPRIARRLADKLIGGPRRTRCGSTCASSSRAADWDEQIRDAIEVPRFSVCDDRGQRPRLLGVRGRMGLGAEVQEADHTVAVRPRSRAAVSALVPPVHRFHRVRHRAWRSFVIILTGWTSPEGVLQELTAVGGCGAGVAAGGRRRERARIEQDMERVAGADRRAGAGGCGPAGGRAATRGRIETGLKASGSRSGRPRRPRGRSM